MPPKSTQDLQLAELKKLRVMVEEIKTDVDKEANKPFWKKMLNAFVIGIARGLGIIIGTTVIVGIIIYLLQIFVNWTDLQIGFVEWLTDIVEQGVTEAVPAGISSFIR